MNNADRSLKLAGYRSTALPLNANRAEIILFPPDDLTPEARGVIARSPGGEYVNDVAFRAEVSAQKIKEAKRAIATFGYARVHERDVEWSGSV